MKKIFIYYFQKESPDNKLGYPLIFMGLNIIFHGVIYNSLKPAIFIFSLYLLITSVLVGMFVIIRKANKIVKSEKKYSEIKQSKNYTDYDWENIFVDEGLSHTYLSEEDYTNIKNLINNTWKYQFLIIFIYLCMLFFMLGIVLYK